MTNSTKLFLACCLALPRTTAAQGIASGAVIHGTLAFDANATLGAFTGTSAAATGAMTGGSSLGAVRGWVEAPTASLTTHNGHRDSDMAGSLEPAKFPTLRFDLDSVVAGDVHGDSTAVTLNGRLKLHGQTRQVGFPGWVFLAPGSARFRGALPVNVKDYGVGGLSKMLGMLKMNEMITIRVDVTFSPPSPSKTY